MNGDFDKIYRLGQLGLGTLLAAGMFYLLFLLITTQNQELPQISSRLGSVQTEIATINKHQLDISKALVRTADALTKLETKLELIVIRSNY
jgi:septal ring factor EnvC (AmiA/AmiB activator)